MPAKGFPVTPDDLVARSFTLSVTPGGAGAKTLTLPYRLYVPRDYVQSRRYPLVVVLHGAGEKGIDNQKHLGNGVLAFCDPALQKRTPAFVVYPQCWEGARWVESAWSEGRYDQAKVPLSEPLTALLALVPALAKEFTLDPARLLCAGLSMGGYGTWDLITRFPAQFAGAVAICGGGDPTRAFAAKNVPVWAFHGSADEVVPVRGSRLMVEALRKAGGKVKYTEWKGADHHIWERVFKDPAVPRWLLAQKQAGRPAP